MIIGQGVSCGIEYGKAVIFKNQKRIIKKKQIKNSTLEIERLHRAITEISEEINEVIKTIQKTEKEIMEAYLMVMQDAKLVAEVEELIRNEKYNAEYAIEIGLDDLIKTFKNIDDEYMSSRVNDIIDIKEKIINKLLKDEKDSPNKCKKGTIIVTNDLSALDMVQLNLEEISGIIIENGSEESHCSIIARTYNIPVVIKAENATNIIKNNDYIAINGKTGMIYINPTLEDMKELSKIKLKIKEEKYELKKYKNIPTKTKDEYVIKLFSNIGLATDVKEAIKNSAEGIGLIRSEILYMKKNKILTEEEQFCIYKKVAEEFKGKSIVIRTLDIGGDKELEYIKLNKESNPFLGCRAIRFCLDNLDIFRSQLKAILRASAYGNLSIMFPMISSIEELRKTKEILEDCKIELNKNNIQFKNDIKIGIMIEVPSAALISGQLAKECDFFSIGTNDLIQYTVAAERGNEKVSNLYTKYHPAVLKLIKETIVGASSAGIMCGICGESAGDELLIPIWIGMGLDELSVGPNIILKTRKIICGLEKSKCEELVEHVLKYASAKQIEEELKKWNKKYLSWE